MAYFPGTGWNALAAGLQGAGDMFINMYKMKEAERQQKLADEEAATRLGLAKSSNELAQKTFDENVRRNKEQALDDAARLQMVQREELRRQAQMMPGQRIAPEMLERMRTAGMGPGELATVQPDITEMGVKRALTESDYPGGLPANAIPGVEFQQPQEGGWFFKGDLLTPEQRQAQAAHQLDVTRVGMAGDKQLEDIRQFDAELALRARAIGVQYEQARIAGDELKMRQAKLKWDQEVAWPLEKARMEAETGWYGRRTSGGAGTVPPWRQPGAGPRPVTSHTPTAGTGTVEP